MNAWIFNKLTDGQAAMKDGELCADSNQIFKNKQRDRTPLWLFQRHKAAYCVPSFTPFPQSAPDLGGETDGSHLLFKKLVGHVHLQQVAE